MDLTFFVKKWNYEKIYLIGTWAHMTEISSFALFNEFFLRGAIEQNTR